MHLLRQGGKEVVPFELTIVNLIDDPTVGGLVVTAHDVSARVKSDRELRHALSLLQATLDSTADGILVVDTGGAIAGFNDRFREMWGIPDHLLVIGKDSEAIAYVVDQLIDPQDFVAKLEELPPRPKPRATTSSGSGTAASSRATRGRNWWRDGSSVGSGASATSPSAPGSRPSWPTRPFTTG